MTSKQVLKHKYILLIVLIFSGCSSKAQKPGSSELPKYMTIAQNKYGASVQYLYNESKTHVICYKTSKPDIQNPFANLQYFIYDLGNKQIIREEELNNGKIRWLDDFKIETTIIPGMVQKGSPAGKHIEIIDLRKE